MNLPICVWQYISEFLTFPEQQHLRACCKFLSRIEIRKLPSYLHRLVTASKIKRYPYIRKLWNMARVTDLSPLKHLHTLTTSIELRNYPPSLTKLVTLKDLHLDRISSLRLQKLEIHRVVFGTRLTGIVTESLTSLKLSTGFMDISNLKLKILHAPLTCKISHFPTTLTSLNIRGRTDIMDIPLLNLKKLDVSYGCFVRTFPTSLISLNINNREDIVSLPELPLLSSLSAAGTCGVTSFPTTLTCLDVTNRGNLDVSYLFVSELYASGTKTDIPKTVKILDSDCINLSGLQLTTLRTRNSTNYGFVDVLQAPTWSACRKFICTAVTFLSIPISCHLKTYYYPVRVEYFGNKTLKTDIL